jgi:hypothetical protein
MLPMQVGLIDMTGKVNAETMAAVAAALNIQVTRDLSQYWPINATVAYLPNPQQVPQGVWPVVLVESLPPGEGGFHTTERNQPYAMVAVTPGSDQWMIEASHETIEMLVDPSGNRLQASTAVQIVGNEVQDNEAAGRFEYLVEACDPCEADAYTYAINGIRVSDFITPHFYDPTVTPGTRYSFTGAVQRPRQVLPGGYISWLDPKTSELMQILCVQPNQPPLLKDLGSGASNGLAARENLRVFVENQTLRHVQEHRTPPSDKTRAARSAYRDALAAAAALRARHYKY